jgi:hypothetical protein
MLKNKVFPLVGYFPTSRQFKAGLRGWLILAKFISILFYLTGKLLQYSIKFLEKLVESTINTKSIGKLIGKIIEPTTICRM